MKGLLIALTLISTSAFGNMNNSKVDLQVLEAGKCKRLKLTVEQKKDIKSGISALRKDLRKHKAELKKARAEFRSVMTNVSTTEKEAMAAKKELRGAKQPIKKLRNKFLNNVNFNILSGEQRVKLFKCTRKVKRKTRKMSKKMIIKMKLKKKVAKKEVSKKVTKK